MVFLWKVLGGVGTASELHDGNQSDIAVASGAPRFRIIKKKKFSTKQSVDQSLGSSEWTWKKSGLALGWVCRSISNENLNTGRTINSVHILTYKTGLWGACGASAILHLPSFALFDLFILFERLLLIFCLLCYICYLLPSSFYLLSPLFNLQSSIFYIRSFIVYLLCIFHNPCAF